MTSTLGAFSSLTVWGKMGGYTDVEPIDEAKSPDPPLLESDDEYEL